MQNLRDSIIYEGIKFATRDINLNFIIKVMGVNNGQQVERLVGVSGLLDEVGSDLANSVIGKAFGSEADKVVCKLRRGLRIIFFRR